MSHIGSKTTSVMNHIEMKRDNLCNESYRNELKHYRMSHTETK